MPHSRSSFALSTAPRTSRPAISQHRASEEQPSLTRFPLWFAHFPGISGASQESCVSFSVIYLQKCTSKPVSNRALILHTRETSMARLCSPCHVCLHAACQYSVWLLLSDYWQTSPRTPRRRHTSEPELGTVVSLMTTPATGGGRHRNQIGSRRWLGTMLFKMSTL